MTKQYDAIALFGYSFGPDWKLPQHLVERLQIAAKYYVEGRTPRIVVMGLRSFYWDWAGKIPPVTEYELMSDVLHEAGVPQEDVMQETKSQDTPSNLYYLKTDILAPNNIKSVLLMCGSHHEARCRLFAEKILGDDVDWDIETTHSPGSDKPEIVANEKKTLKEYGDWLKPMKPGDHQWLDGKFFEDPFYLKKRERAEKNGSLQQTIDRAK